MEPTTETHRTTRYEIFFDLVFVFALTRITAYMVGHASPLTLLKGLVVLLLWISWLIYAWLGNQARADIGLIRAGTTAAMGPIFLIAVVIPNVWGPGLGSRLILVLSYLVVRIVHLALYRRAAEGDRRLHRTLRLYTTTTALSWIPFVVGAVLGGDVQLWLWTAAVAVDFAALFGGVARYLAGDVLFRGLSVGSVPPAQLLAPVVALALLPAGRFLPGLVALALLAAFLVVPVGYERVFGAGRASSPPVATTKREPGR
ncbi:low temperature requirement protein A [Micromonospora andamanensis]|uniref:low temperature requirement protein A n=1 Tax=Micromonospora andamanensis TaxID=1287068 RepID=UPI00194EA87C|nr:low temperature requirement protein A [Micromonospora andamanensis]